MPRKVKTAESVAQNRDSQRRSRARRRAAMDEMHKQLQEYRHHGAAASRELQLAAREVARENRRLRAMLAHCGISTDEIQAFLCLPDEAVAVPGATGDVLSHGLENTHAVTRPPCHSRDAHTHLMPGESRGPDSRGSDTPTQDATTPLETSCTVAADLIADLHGHITVAKALMMLGCSGASDCRVKNTQVFQLMDGVI